MRDTCCVLKIISWLTLVGAHLAGSTVDATWAVVPSKKEAELHSFAPGPASNDFLANALKVNAQPLWTHTTSNTSASMEPGEQTLRHGDNANATASIWYTWSVRERSELLVDTAGSTFATVVAVYSGTSISGLVKVAEASSETQGRDAWVRFIAEPNVSYKIAIAGIPPSPTGVAAVRFEVNGEPDLLPPLIEITRPASGATVREPRVRIEGVAFDPQPNGSGVREVQYSLGIEGNLFTYTAQGTSNFAANIDLVPGENVVSIWAVDNADLRSVTRRISVLFNQVISTNDLFVDRFLLDPGTGTRGDISSGATREPGEPSHAGNPGGASIWYEFSSQQSGVLLLSTFGSSFDTLLAVYQSSAGTSDLPVVTNLTEIASNDDVAGGAGESELTVTVVPGGRYFIAVDGFDGQSGLVQLNHQFSPAPIYILTVLPGIGGSVSPGSGAYPENSTVTILAKPSAGFEFDYFETSSGQVRQNPLPVVMSRDVSVQAVFRVRQYAEDFENGFSFDFDLSGWSVQLDPTNSANNVLAALGNRVNSTTNTAVLVLQVSDGVGSFDFGVSTERNFDRLEFFVSYLENDGESTRNLLGSWSGEARGRHQFALRAGTARLEWRYIKDAAISDGADLVFIDQLDLPVFSAQPFVSIQGQTLNMRVPGLGTQSVRIESSSDLQTWSVLTTASPNAAGEVSFVEPVDGAARFYRLIPLQPSFPR